MKSNFKTGPLIWVATLMMFAMVAIGLQPLLFSSGSGCTCDATASVDAEISLATCCASLAEVQHQNNCCSSKPTKSKPCCCNAETLACECGDCGCSEDEDSNSSLPAIPPSETKVVSPTLISSAPWLGFPRENEIKRAGFPQAVAEFAALSSQQTCVLLSRFTC